MTEASLIGKFIQRLKEGKASDAKTHLEEVINLKIKHKHEKASKEID
jgi:hypothetical protein